MTSSPGHAPTVRVRRVQPAALIAPLGVAVGLILLWHTAVIAFDIKPFALPGPIAVWEGFADRPAVFIGFALNTLSEAVSGFAVGLILGISAAIAVFRLRLARRIALLYSSALIAIPVVAVVPLVAVFVGLTPTARIIVVAIATTPVIFNFTMAGLLSTPPDMVELFRSIASDAARTAASLYLPRSMPFVLDGSKVALPAAFSIAIIAEFFGGELTTLGTFIKSSAVQTRVADVWGAAFMAFIFAGLLYAAVALLDRTLTRRSSSPA